MSAYGLGLHNTVWVSVFSERFFASAGSYDCPHNSLLWISVVERDLEGNMHTV